MIVIELFDIIVFKCGRWSFLILIDIFKLFLDCIGFFDSLLVNEVYVLCWVFDVGIYYGLFLINFMLL